MQKKLTKRKLQSIKTMEKIYATAIELFAKYDFSEVTVDRICKKANVSKGGFYNHFKSKEEIIIIEFSKSDKEYTRFHSTLPQDISSTEQIMAFSEFVLQYIDNVGKGIIRVVYQSQISSKKKVSSIADKQRPLYTTFESIIKEGQINGELRNDIDSADVTKMLIRCIRGILFDWLISEDNSDLVSMGNKLISVFVNGLRK